MPFQIIRNNITKVKADAIVNTANPKPRIGRGTDSAIYAAAGEQQLLEERKKIGEIAPGQAASTDAFNLDAKYIIHTVGPAWVDGVHGERDILRSCYEKSLELAAELKCKSILVTCIASIGKNTMLGNTGSFNQQINGLTPNENERDPYFLLTESALWSAKMKNSAAAGTMQIVNRTEFSELKTWLPSLIEQQAISDFFRQLDHLITLHQRELEKLQNIKKSMLEKMFV